MSSKQFTAKTFAWLRQINRGRYLAMDLKVALELIEYFNERDQNGRAYPSYKIIGERIGVSEHTVIRSIQRLHDGGDLYVIWGKPGRGNPNQYWMIIKPAPAQVSAAGKPARRSARKPASEAKKTCTATQENHLKNHLADGECLRTPPSAWRESSRLRANDDSLIGGPLRRPPIWSCHLRMGRRSKRRPRWRLQSRLPRSNPHEPLR